MMPVCRSKVCAAAQTTSYDVDLTLSPSAAVPIAAVPYSVTATRTASASMSFTGSIANPGDAAINVTVALTYSNTAVPAIVVTQLVPVTVTVPPNTVVPVATNVTASIPCGVYDINVTLQGSASGSITAHGSLAVDLVYN